MKFSILILVFTLFSGDCNTKITSEASLSNVNQKTITMVYRASSRGFFEEITVSKSTITISNDRTGKNIQTIKNTTKNWDVCLKLLTKIDLYELPNIEAPTSMRDIDGAAHATLIIKEASGEIQSKTFDHEYPPTEIKSLVEKLLSLKKNSPKQ